MSSEKTTSRTDQKESTQLWQEIDALVREVASLARTDCSKVQFYSQLLDGTVRAMAAIGGAVWMLNSANRLELQSELKWNETGLAENDSAKEQHELMLAEVLRQNIEVLLPPDSDDAEQMTNPTSCLLLIHPINVDGRLLGLIEIFQRPERSATAQAGYQHFMQTMVELAADFHRHAELKQLRTESNHWAETEQFTQQVHHNLHLDQTAYRLVNEGQSFIGCDRLSLLRLKGKKYRLMAVSGLDKIDRRSAVARLLEQITARVLVTHEPLLFTGDIEDLPPQIENPLKEYLELSKTRILLIYPLPQIEDAIKAKETTIVSYQGIERPPLAEFALVVEKFDAENLEGAFDSAVDSVVRQGQLAMHNSLTHHNLPMRWVMAGVAKATWFLRGSRFPKTMTALVFITVAVCAMIFIQDDFYVSGRGELQPKEQHHLFAGIEGVVARIHPKAKHGQQVNSNDLLLEISSTKLAYDLAQLEGEQQTIRAELDVLQITLRAGLPTTAEERLKHNRAIAEQEELKVRLKSSRKQVAILNKQEQELQVRSPITGEVLTWDVAQSLEARPVNRGQKLLTIANPKGIWLLEMKIPDRQIQQVQQQLKQHSKQHKERIRLTFILATEPDQTYTLEKEATEFHLSTTTETDISGEAFVRLTVEVNHELIPQEALRPGATILPKLHCGKRSLGYVWFHDLIHVIKTKVLF